MDTRPGSGRAASEAAGAAAASAYTDDNTAIENAEDAEADGADPIDADGGPIAAVTGGNGRGKRFGTVVTLATRMRDGQQAEIEMLRNMLTKLGARPL